jgi:hypothetical protein
MEMQKLVEILMELRSACTQVNQTPTEENLKKLMHKYDMLFVGKDFNCIYTSELAHSINTVFNIHIENDELTKLIPNVCKLLNMKYEPMVEVAKASMINPPIACYQITLW